MRYISGMYIDKDSYMITTVPDELQSYYKLLGCSCIEAPSIKVDGRYFDVICDEEALCRGDIPRCTVGVRMNETQFKPLIHGPCFVCKADEEGNWCSPTYQEFKALEKALACDSEGFPVLLAEGS